jgi:tetratricopeptide (TPR) repeat protein
MNAAFPVMILLMAPMLGTPPGSPPPQDAAARASRPATNEDGDAAVQQAQSIIQHGRFEQGMAQLKELQARNPGLKGVDRELGLAYYQHGNFMEATASLKKALAENPGDREAVQLLGLSYYFTDQPADAIPLLEKVNSWFPSANVDASYVLGICHIRQRQYDDARKSFALMYGVKPDSAPAYLFSARMLLRQDVELIAEQFAHKAAALDPKLPLAHYLLGEIYLYKSRIPEATAEFEKELAINPAHAATYYKLADAYSRSLKFDDAQQLLQRSIWLDATSSGPYILMGKVLLKKNEAELAIRSLQHALDMDPNNYITHHLLGEAFRAQGKSKDASRELKLAEQLQGVQREQR